MTAVCAGYVVDQGSPIHYIEWGNAGSPPIIMFGGARHFAYEWRALAERLEGDRHIVGVDPRGHGHSAPFPGGRYDPALFVNDLLAVINAMHLIRPVIVGFSVVGSGAAVEFAARYPEKVGAIVLVDGGPGYDKPKAEAAYARFQEVPESFASWTEAVDYLSKMGDQSYAAENVVQERAPYVLRSDPDGRVRWRHDASLRGMWVVSGWERNTGAQPEEIWKRVECPILVLKTASKHHLSEVQCDEMVQYGKGSEWVRIPNIESHFVYDENPDAFVETVRPFLEKVVRE